MFGSDSGDLTVPDETNGVSVFGASRRGSWRLNTQPTELDRREPEEVRRPWRLHPLPRRLTQGAWVACGVLGLLVGVGTAPTPEGSMYLHARGPVPTVSPEVTPVPAPTTSQAPAPARRTEVVDSPASTAASPPETTREVPSTTVTEPPTTATTAPPTTEAPTTTTSSTSVPTTPSTDPPDPNPPLFPPTTQGTSTTDRGGIVPPSIEEGES